MAGQGVRLPLVCLCLVALVMSLTAAGTDFCSRDTFTASCDHNEVVLMQEAVYGRMRTGCSGDFMDSECRADVLSVMDRKCSGHRKCSLPIPLTEFPAPPSCTGVPRADLSMRARYRCVRTAQPDRGSECPMLLETAADGAGFISSGGPHSSLSRAMSCPWRIQVPAGRQINVTLWDLDTEVQTATSVCRVYALLKEPDRGRTLCRGDQRRRLVFTSRGPLLDVYVVSSRDDPAHFLLEYRALGCPPPPRGPAYLSVIRQQDRATVLCHSGEHYTLQCRGSVWHGDPAPCGAASRAGGSLAVVSALALKLVPTLALWPT